MTREVWRGLLIAVALTIALAALFFHYFERSTKTVDYGYSPEARLNDYLAATRFLNRMGIPAEGMPSPTPQSTLPRVDEVLLLTTKRLTVDADTQDALLAWVRSGGHLIVAARTETVFDGIGDLFEQINEVKPERDRLFDALGLALEVLDLDQGELSEYGPFAADFPQAERFVWIGADPDDRLAGDDQQWPPLAGDTRGAVLRSGALGAGHVSIIADRRILHNRLIDEHDHALFLWHLVNLYGMVSKVWVVSEDDMPALPAWLWQHARELVISVVLLTLLILAARVPRFGPLQGVAPPRRRSLIEHLRASGSFQWRYGDHAALLQGIRAELRREITLKHPATAAMDPARAATHLAELLDLPEADIRQAVTPAAGSESNLSREAFTRAVDLLTALRKRL